MRIRIPQIKTWHCCFLVGDVKVLTINTNLGGFTFPLRESFGGCPPPLRGTGWLLFLLLRFLFLSLFLSFNRRLTSKRLFTLPILWTHCLKLHHGVYWKQPGSCRCSLKVVQEFVLTQSGKNKIIEILTVAKTNGRWKEASLCKGGNQAIYYVGWEEKGNIREFEHCFYKSWIAAF